MIQDLQFARIRGWSAVEEAELTVQPGINMSSPSGYSGGWSTLTAKGGYSCSSIVPRNPYMWQLMSARTCTAMRPMQVQTAELRAAAGQTSLMETLLPVNAVH